MCKGNAESEHQYWYARYIENKWINTKICNSGKWFPQTPEGKTEPEPHYFGGITVHPDNGNVVYLSREINGIFEIDIVSQPVFGIHGTSGRDCIPYAIYLL